MSSIFAMKSKEIDYGFRKKLKSYERGLIIDSFVNGYLDALNTNGRISRDRVREELTSIFIFIRTECEKYGRNKARIAFQIHRIVSALNAAINCDEGGFLLLKWRDWEDMLDPSSEKYIGINLPGSMILEGYVVFEDLIPIREYFEKKYIDGTFAPK